MFSIKNRQVIIVKSIIHVVHKVDCDTQLTQRVSGRPAARRRHSWRPEIGPLDRETNAPARRVLDIYKASSILTPHMV